MRHHRVSRLRERRRLTVDFSTMKIELGEHPWKFLLRVDQRVKELERVARPMDPKNVDIVIVRGRTSQYDAVVRMLESSSDRATREIERAAINQYDRLQSERPAASCKAIPPFAVLWLTRKSHDSRIEKICRRLGIKKKPNSRRSRDNDNSGRDSCSACGRAGGMIKFKNRGSKGGDDADEGYKLIRTGCYFCKGPH